MKHTHKNRILEYIEENSQVFTDVSRKIWAHPELSLKEKYAAELYTSLLKENGFLVETGIGGMETAFVGRFGHGRPMIAFLGEYDALSGLSQKACAVKEEPLQEGAPGHGCGHNMLGAGSLAAAFAVKDYLERTDREGTVLYYGCPGEEGGAGKTFLARDGEWYALDAALTWHPSDVNEVVSGTNNSCIQILYDYFGTAAHAAGDPENGRSALDAVELMNTGVQYLREHMAGDCRIHYAITNTGGVSPNVVQARASVLYMVRANKVKDSKRLLERVDKIAQGAALMTETTFKRTLIDGTAELVPNYVLEEALYDNFRNIPLPAYTDEERAYAAALEESCDDNSTPGIGSKYDSSVAEQVRVLSASGTRPINDFLIPLVHTEGFTPGSSDVGDVSWQTPTAQIHTASFVGGSPGHSWQNVSCGATGIGDKALLLAGKVLACTAVDLLEQPDLLEKARKEFEKRTAGGYVSPIEKDTRPVAL